MQNQLGASLVSLALSLAGLKLVVLVEVSILVLRYPRIRLDKRVILFVAGGGHMSFHIGFRVVGSRAKSSMVRRRVTAT